MGCAAADLQFYDASTPDIISWLWDFGDIGSGIDNTSDLHNPQHLYTNPGTYDISLTVTSVHGCTNSALYPSVVNIYPTPVAIFTADPQVASISEPTVMFYDQTIGASQWLWDFGDISSGSNNFSTYINPIHNFINAGEYDVWLVVGNEYNCFDSTVMKIIVKDEFTFYIPNTFTPNDDGTNDIFIPQGHAFDLNTFEMYIFDRWGEIIFETKNAYKGWDGKVKGSGKEAQVGVYTYLIIVKEKYTDILHRYIGHINIIR